MRPLCHSSRKACLCCCKPVSHMCSLQSASGECWPTGDLTLLVVVMHLSELHLCCVVYSQLGGSSLRALTSLTPNQAQVPPHLHPVTASRVIAPDQCSQGTARCEPSAAAAAPTAASGRLCTRALARAAATQAATQAAAAAARLCWVLLGGRLLRRVWTVACWWGLELSVCSGSIHRQEHCSRWVRALAESVTAANLTQHQSGNSPHEVCLVE
jgi:hypothetical protein